MFFLVFYFDSVRPFFFKNVSFTFLVEFELFLLARVCHTADCNVLRCRDRLVAPLAHMCTTNQRWSMFEPECLEQVLPLPPDKAASKITAL